MTVLADEDTGLAYKEAARVAAGSAVAAPGGAQSAPPSVGMPRRVRFEVAVQQALARIIEIVAAGTEEVSAVLWMDDERGDDGLPNGDDGLPNGETAATPAHAPIDFAAFARARAADRRRRLEMTEL